MEEIPNICEWNDPYDILNLFDTRIYGDRNGIMYVTSASEQMLLLKYLVVMFYRAKMILLNI